jgi:hypothetical protein
MVWECRGQGAGTKNDDCLSCGMQEMKQGKLHTPFVKNYPAFWVWLNFD